MRKQIIRCCESAQMIIVQQTKGFIATTAQQRTDFTIIVIMIYTGSGSR
jgi:hypothetical protein